MTAVWKLADDRIMGLFHCTVLALLNLTWLRFLAFPLGIVPGTWYFLVPALVRFQASWASIKMWRQQAAGHWLLRESSLEESWAWRPTQESNPPFLNTGNSVTVIRLFSLALCVTESHKLSSKYTIASMSSIVYMFVTHIKRSFAQPCCDEWKTTCLVLKPSRVKSNWAK